MGYLKRPLITKHVRPVEDEVVSRLIDASINMEMYLIMSTVYNKTFDRYREYTSKHPIGTEPFQYLLREGFIQSEDSKYNIEEIMLTAIGLDLFVQDDNSVDIWIEDWRNLWPKGVSSGGYPVRADLPSITKKMKAFVKKYKHSKEKIFRVTKDYLADKQIQNWTYVKTAA